VAPPLCGRAAAERALFATGRFVPPEIDEALAFTQDFKNFFPTEKRGHGAVIVSTRSGN